MSRRSQLKWLVPLFLFIIDCGGVPRDRDRMVVTVSGTYKHALDERKGCNSQPNWVQKDRQVGGGVGIKFRRKSGWNFGGNVQMMEGETVELTRHEMDTPTPTKESRLAELGDDKSYSMHGFNLWFGYDRRHIGFELGFNQLLLDGAVATDNNMALPYGRLKVGLMDKQWVSLGTGTQTPFLGYDLLHSSATIRRGRFMFSGGFAIQGHIVPSHIDTLHQPATSDVSRRRLDLGTEGDFPDLNFVTQFDYRFSDFSGLHIAGSMGYSNTIRIGLNLYRFGKSDRPPAKAPAKEPSKAWDKPVYPASTPPKKSDGQ